MKIYLVLLLLFYGITPYAKVDLNHDGRISTTDIVILNIALSNHQSVHCDANHDGNTDENDVFFLRYYLANRR